MSTTASGRMMALGLSLAMVVVGTPAVAAAGLAPEPKAAPGDEANADAEPGEGEPDASEANPDEASPDEEPEVDPAEATRAEAAEAYTQGSDLYELGKYPEAIVQFQRAWELSRKEQLLYNLGQAHWKWFDIEPDIDHLRQAALFFRNYDKRMRLTEGYDPVEIDNILKAIDAQIENEERKIAEANRPVLVQPGGPTEEELAWERRRRTTRALNVSGTTIIVVGGVTLAAGLASLLTRLGFKLVLDSSTASDGGFNVASAEEDTRRRSAFLTTGQVAFGTLIAAAAILPVGIALRVTGAVREKQDRAQARERDQQRERNAQKAKVAIEPTLGGVRVRF